MYVRKASGYPYSQISVDRKCTAEAKLSFANNRDTKWTSCQQLQIILTVTPELTKASKFFRLKMLYIKNEQKKSWKWKILLISGSIGPFNRHQTISHREQFDEKCNIFQDVQYFDMDPENGSIFRTHVKLFETKWIKPIMPLWMNSTYEQSKKGYTNSIDKKFSRKTPVKKDEVKNSWICQIWANKLWKRRRSQTITAPSWNLRAVISRLSYEMTTSAKQFSGKNDVDEWLK